MKRKLIRICLLACLLCSCQGNKESNTEKNSTAPDTTSAKTSTTESSSTESSSTKKEYHVSKKLDNSKIYLELNKSFSLPTTFFTETAEIPYIELNDFFVNFFSKHVMESTTDFFTISNNVVTNRFSNASMVFHTDSNTITTDDLDQFTNYTTSLKTPMDIVDSATDNLAKLNTEKTTYTKGDAVTFNLSDYKMNLISYEDKIYVPFSIIESIGLSSIFTRFAFNGDDYYNASTTSFFDSEKGTLNEFGTKFASGSLFKNSTRTETYANYFYYSFLFELTNYDGHYPISGIKDLDAQIEKDGLKEKILSTNSDTANAAAAYILMKYLSDGGHTAFYHRGMTSTYDAKIDMDLMKLIAMDERYMATMQVYQQLASLRKETTPLVEYSADNNTAMIHFDSFVQHTEAITKNNVTKDESTFATLYLSFEEIKTNTSVKNVVFDVSLNGGGAAIALAEALSFMTDDPVEITVKNMKTNAVIKECLDFDNNLDGSTIDNDSYSGKYNFYILTSPYSFSCGNAFPNIAKDKGYAKIIGQRSGGGDCAVLPGITIDGGVFTMSSNYSIRRTDGTSVDDGCAVDIELAYEKFYDVDAVNTAITNAK